MYLRIFAILGVLSFPFPSHADIPVMPEKTMRYEISSDLGGQRKTVHEHRQERRDILKDKYAGLTKEEIREKIDERFGHLTPEERQAKLDELHHYRKMLREELEGLPPEARAHRMQELRAAYDEHGMAAFDDLLEEKPDVEPAE